MYGTTCGKDTVNIWIKPTFSPYDILHLHNLADWGLSTRTYWAIIDSSNRFSSARRHAFTRTSAGLLAYAAAGTHVRKLWIKIPDSLSVNTFENVGCNVATILFKPMSVMKMSLEHLVGLTNLWRSYQGVELQIAVYQPIHLFDKSTRWNYI